MARESFREMHRDGYEIESITCMIPVQHKQALREHCKIRGMTMTEFVKRAIEQTPEYETILATQLQDKLKEIA